MTDLQAANNAWSPGTESRVEQLGRAPAAALAATLGRDVPSGLLPPLWHWLYFLDWTPAAELGEDGHPRAGAFLPPIPDRTRMFVGGRISFRAALQLDVESHRRSVVTDRVVKQGATGEMLFVTVRHEIEQDGHLALIDEQDLMYRSGAASRDLTLRGPAQSDSTVQRPPFSANEALLFRFSALTANTHRIHYDHPYATEVERYPGLVVHGPLLAVLMAELAQAELPVDHSLTQFDYRFHRPSFAGDEVIVGAEPEADATQVRAVIGNNETVATARASFARNDAR